MEPSTDRVAAWPAARRLPISVRVVRVAPGCAPAGAESVCRTAGRESSVIDCDHDDDIPDDWTDQQRAIFNRVYRHMLSNQTAFVHPQASRVEDEHWSTTAWNAAWFAAHVVNNEAPFIVHSTDDGSVFAAEQSPNALN